MHNNNITKFVKQGRWLRYWKWTHVASRHMIDSKHDILFFMHINIKSFTWGNKEMIKSCLDLSKGLKNWQRDYIKHSRWRVKRKPIRKWFDAKKSDALLVKAFVNCKYYWCKKVIKLLLVRNLRQLQVLHVDICSFFLVYVVLFCFLCCNLMIGHMAYNVPWDFQIDDCKISRIYISYKSCYIAQSA